MTYAEVWARWKHETFLIWTYSELTPVHVYQSFSNWCIANGIEPFTQEQFQMVAETDVRLLRIAVRPVLRDLQIESGAIPLASEESADLYRRLYPERDFQVSWN